MKAVLYFKYLLSENVSLLILWNSVKQLEGFLSQGYHQPTKEHLYFFYLIVMLQRVFVMIPAKVWSMGMGRTVTCPPCILLTRNVNGNAEIFLPAFSVDVLSEGLPPGPCRLECFLECPRL